MKVKVAFSGGAVRVPWRTEMLAGSPYICVWVDGNGFTGLASASNQTGSPGYVLLETPEIDIGEIDEQRRNIFTNLHGRVVTWNIKTSSFVRMDGEAHIAMTVGFSPKDPVGGVVVDRKIEFQAHACTGVSVVTNALDFWCEMRGDPRPLAYLGQPPSESKLATWQQVIPDSVIVAAADAAPAANEGHA
jgi:hypothetical protein